MAGPLGAAIGGATGAALTMALKKLGSEVAQRILSPREQARIGFVLGQAVIEIRQRIDRGDALRADGFFDAQQGSRSNAEEVAESVLLKSPAGSGRKESCHIWLIYLQTLHSIQQLALRWHTKSRKSLSSSLIDSSVY